MVSAIIALTHELKLNVVAEGVETEEQLSFLGKQRCDSLQGFIFSKPEASETLEPGLKRPSSNLNYNPTNSVAVLFRIAWRLVMEKTYLWLVYAPPPHHSTISAADIVECGLPCASLTLNKHYHSFVLDRKESDGFWRAIKKIVTWEFKVYEFSDKEVLLGEYYVAPLRNISVYIPWLFNTSLVPASHIVLHYFFFVDFNATFSVTDELLGKYLDKIECQFYVLDCVKTEPVFYTGDNYYVSKLKVQMHYADVLLVLGLLFKMVVENHRIEDEGSMTILYGQFDEGRVRLFDRWCIPNIWTLSHDASFGHEMPLFCQWEFDQAIRKFTDT